MPEPRDQNIHSQEVGGEVPEKKNTDSESPPKGDAEAEQMEEQCRLQKRSLS